MTQGYWRTFTQNFPFAGLAAGRVGQDRIQVIEESLHFASSFPLSHLVRYPKLGRSAVVA